MDVHLASLALKALSHDAVEEAAAVVAEGGSPVGVDGEAVGDVDAVAVLLPHAHRLGLPNPPTLITRPSHRGKGGRGTWSSSVFDSWHFQTTSWWHFLWTTTVHTATGGHFK